MTRKAFTLIELLVVLSIIALLTSILLPSLSGARNMAKQVKASSAQRQLMMGYAVYQADFQGYVMWGLPPAFVEGQPLEVTMPSGHRFSSASGLALAIIRYPGRIASYQQHAWEILYDHVPPPDLPRASDSQEQAKDKLYDLSVNPSFGINATYVGGSYGEDGFVNDGGVFRMNRGKHVVFRQGEARRPSQLIVFGDTEHYAGGVKQDEGYHLLTPPHADGQQWHVEGGRIAVHGSGFLGIPQGRYSDAALMAFFDGHVAPMTPEKLDDMRLWSNDAQGPDDDYDP
jgi:prepilin-type N-terminal cleavage/methylation domain-containing protein/prepilin-type processing-associated H-X9-DG protein